MATKKAPAKKRTTVAAKTAKKPVVKKVVAKKAPIKKTTTRRSVTTSVAPDFWKIDFTINTVYWLIIGVAVLATASIAYNTNQQINDIYDRIDSSTVQDY